MTETKVERETKFEVPPDFEVPDLARAVDDSARTERRTVALTSTYFDTSDRALLAHSVTLRRRVGDVDSGWQLKVPTGPARTEVRLPLADGDDASSVAEVIPSRIAELVTGLAHGQPLQPVAQIKTERHLHQIVLDSQVTAEIADDRVHASTFGDAVRVTEWREVEIELGTGDEQLLPRLGRELIAAGARPAEAASKLGRALGWNDPVSALPTAAGRLIAGYLNAQVQALGSGDVALRRGLDTVHKTRVAARRYRSILRVYAPLFEPERSAGLDAELSWYQDLLGAVRDRQVQRARFAAAVHALPPTLVLGPVAADIEQTLRGEELAAEAELKSGLDSDRYHRLLAAAQAWAQAPPLRPAVATDEILARAKASRRTAAKRLKRALRSADPTLLHRARKATKRSRYATELTVPEAGRAAKRKLKNYKRLQDVLGEHQDSVVAMELLQRLGAAAGAGPEHNGFTYGLLWERERATAAAKRAEAARFRL